MAVSYEMLNVNQRCAVDWGDGPLLVLSGPGSGKTAILTLRIANLIESSRDESYRILGLTFTKKAANEMQNRVRNLIGEDWRRVKLCTFHSFCTDILRQHGSHIGLRPDFSVITDDKDRAAILNEIRQNSELDVEYPEDLLKKIDTMFTHGITVEELPHYFRGREDYCRVLQDIFGKYLNNLIEDNQLDFGSMLHFTREVLKASPRVEKQIRTVYRYVCVDEFQDTNLAQYKILRLLAPSSSANLFAVADDDQIIFQWNGADPKRLEEFKKDYSPQIIKLPENYRCPIDVVDIANRLIKHNRDRMQTEQIGTHHDHAGGEVGIDYYDDFDAEVEGLISKIRLIPENERETCLVIARSNKLLNYVRDAMHNVQLNAEIIRRRQGFANPLIGLLYYTLKLANSIDSRSLLNKLCSTATLVDGITVSAEDVFAKAKVEDLTTLRAFFLLIGASDTFRTFADKGLELLCDSLDYTAFVEISFSLFDEWNATRGEEDVYPDYVDDKESWTLTSDHIRTANGDDISLYAFLQGMDMLQIDPPLSRNCVRLQTVHTAKGVEFDNVFLIGLAEDQFPTYLAAKRGGAAIEEERRSCFVAITRASKNLYLSYSGSYFGWSKEPSRFLAEMGLLSG